MVEQWIQERIRWARGLVMGAARWPLSSLSWTAWNFIWWSQAHEGAIHWELDQRRGWANWWPISAIWDWITDRLHELTSWIFHGIREVGEVGVRWVNGLYDPTFGDWTICREIFMAFLTIEEWGAFLGYHIDHWVGELYDRAWAVAGAALEPIGWALAEAQRLAAGSNYNQWDWIRSISPNVWEAIKLQCQSLGETIWRRITEIDDLLLRLLDPALDPLGWGLGELQRRIAGSNYNPWPWIKSTSPSIGAALKTITEAIADTILWRLDVLVDAIYKAINPRLDTLERFRDELYDFRRDPASYIWDRLYPTLLKRLEYWLNERWDAPVG